MSNQPALDPYGPLFGDDQVAAVFSPRAHVQAMLDVEVALAEAEAEIGVIPASCLAAIRQAADVDFYDLAAIATQAGGAGNLAIPLIKHLTNRVATIDRAAAAYVHWGATSQDTIDTALVRQLQTAIPRVTSHLKRATFAARSLAKRYVDAVMPGRTWLQQATPITFGLKAAGWADALDRQRRSVTAALDEARVLQFGGAAGTLAALGDAGPRVAELLAERLHLKVPDLPWHTQRDRLVAISCDLGMTCGTCGKIARDIALLAQNEVGEAAEGPRHDGGSSTMPHKRNPVSASVALAAAVRAPGLVATMLAAMPQEHERGLGGWQAEWTTLPDLVGLAAGAARATAEALEGLSVDPDRMLSNLALTRGVVMTEAITIALAPHVGRLEAHQKVAEATRLATADGITLADALIADSDISRYFTRDEIQARLSPESYLGAARVFIERVLRREVD